MRYRIKTAPPKGRNTFEPDMGAKVQANLFATVAMIVAASADAEEKLMAAINEAKAGRFSLTA